MTEQPLPPLPGDQTRPSRPEAASDGNKDGLLRKDGLQNADGLQKQDNTKIGKIADTARQPWAKNLRMRIALYNEVKQVLERDPFLAYQDETETVYQVLDGAQEVLIVPKERAVPEPFPVQRPAPIRKAYRLLLYAALGLLLSGLGALIFAPFAGLTAARAHDQLARPADRMRARVIIALALLLFAAGLALAYLLWMHLVG